MSELDMDVGEVQLSQMLKYGVSVNANRHIPSVYDGLKPVQRRILLTCLKGGMRHGRKFKKAANLVGTCMSDWHPHGDGSIFDAAVRMSRDWIMRMPLMDKHGNNGDLAGNPSAAQRYLELRSAKAAEGFFEDLDGGAVDFIDSYDGSRKEPLHLPAPFPNVLVNGASGIGYGFSCDVPPHCPDEVMAALERAAGWTPEMSKEDRDRDALEALKGPDFPTGGSIANPSALAGMYMSGKGAVRVAASTSVERTSNGGGASIVIREIPYGTTTTRIMERIAELSRTDRLKGVTAMQDLSGKAGVRIVVKVSPRSSPEEVRRVLMADAGLVGTVRCNFTLVDDAMRPRTFSIGEVLQAFMDERRRNLVRKYAAELVARHRERTVAVGLLKAIGMLDDVVKAVRSSGDPDLAVRRLVEDMSFLEDQAKAIVAMRMSALTGLGESDLRSKAARLDREISRLEGRLSDGSLLDADILEAARKSLSGMGPRMTDIPSEDVDVVRGAVVEDRDAVVAIAHDGTVRRMPADAFKPQGRGGKGRRAAAGADRAVYCSALSDLLVVTGSGRAIPKKAHEIPEAKLTGRGVPLEALVPLKDGEKAIGLVHVDFSMPHLLFVSAKGHAKRTATEGFRSVRLGGVIVQSVGEDDETFAAFSCGEGGSILAGLTNGRALNTPLSEIRVMERSARGALLFSSRDPGVRMACAEMAGGSGKMLAVFDRGFAKTLPINDFRTVRGSTGRVVKPAREAMRIVGLHHVADESAEHLIMFTKRKAIRVPVRQIPTVGRSARGSRVVDLAEGDVVVASAMAR